MLSLLSRYALLTLLWLPQSVFSTGSPLYKIGILETELNLLSSWDKLAPTLSQRLQQPFLIIPLDSTAIATAIEHGSVDFVITDPGQFSRLSQDHALLPLASLALQHTAPALTSAATIITRADSDIQQINDLRQRAFMAVSMHHFNSFQAARLTLLSQNIDPSLDFSRLDFSGFPASRAVMAVIQRQTEAAAVPAGTLEKMIRDGQINRHDIRVLHRQQNNAYPFDHSTGIWPGWAFAALPHVSNEIQQRLRFVLPQLKQPIHHNGEAYHWAPPQDYQPLQQELPWRPE